mgnify:CR=1 FL=1
MVIKAFTKHPNENGKTWSEHACFALSVSFKLACSSFYFMLHGIMPFIPMPEYYNLESMSSYLLNKNDEVSKKEE